MNLDDGRQDIHATSILPVPHWCFFYPSIYTSKFVFLNVVVLLYKNPTQGCYVIASASSTHMGASVFFWYLLPQSHFFTAWSNVLGYTSLPGNKFTYVEALQSPEVLARNHSQISKALRKNHFTIRTIRMRHDFSHRDQTL
jgi:hypothetical protein